MAVLRVITHSAAAVTEFESESTMKSPNALVRGCGPLQHVAALRMLLAGFAVLPRKRARCSKFLASDKHVLCCLGNDV